MKLQNLKTLLFLMSSQKLKLLFATALSMISNVLGVVPFILVYMMIMELLAPPIDQAVIWKLIVLGVASIALRYAFMSVSLVLSHVAAYDILYDLRLRIAHKLGTLPMGYFNKKSSGELKKIMIDDVEKTELFIAHNFPDLASGIFLPSVILIYLVYLDWRMSLVTLMVFPMAIAAQWMMRRNTPGIMKMYHDAMERMNRITVEYVRGMAVIKAFNLTIGTFSEFRLSVDDYCDLNVLWTKKCLAGWSLFTVSIGACLFFILPAGIILHAMGEIDISTFILFMLLGISVTVPFFKLSTFSSSLENILEGVERINAVLQEKSMEAQLSGKLPENNSVEFRDVSFSYGEGDVLHDVSFHAPEGSITAIVGSSGAGKTTIAHLIPRLWDVGRGSVMIGGVDVREIPADTLNSRVGFVFQDVILFNDTALENIRMGNSQASEEDIIRAAKAAQIHEVIAGLPQGYDTVIGERGSRLSGGEKQRISIARAILKDAPILIIDEGTSNADALNEEKIQEALSLLVKGKTLIVIAHRLSTIVGADRILVMDGGRIVETGVHGELMERDGLYRRLWEARYRAEGWKLRRNKNVISPDREVPMPSTEV